MIFKMLLQFGLSEDDVDDNDDGRETSGLCDKKKKGRQHHLGVPFQKLTSHPGGVVKAKSDSDIVDSATATKEYGEETGNVSTLGGGRERGW